VHVAVQSKSTSFCVRLCVCVCISALNLVDNRVSATLNLSGPSFRNIPQEAEQLVRASRYAPLVCVVPFTWLLIVK
jgi:hypothetical protein